MQGKYLLGILYTPMELEKLTPNQAVLLTLLISFVTSLATGIVTVSLMEKAPSDITRVISRIIEQPIETIVPGQTVTQETTVVVQEGELISKAVAKIVPSIVKIYRSDRGNNLTFVGLGIIADDQGTIMTGGNLLAVKDKYVVMLNNGMQVPAQDIASQTGLRDVLKLEATPDVVLADLPRVSFVAHDTVTLGESVVSIGGGSGNLAVSAGIVTELIPASTESGDVPLIRAGIVGSQVSPGSPLIDLDGKVLGILRDIDTLTFTPVITGSTVGQ